MDDETKIQEQNNTSENRQSENVAGESSLEQQAKELYEELGVDKPVPKAKGRPKGSGKRDKDIQEDGNRRSSAGNNKDGKGKNESSDAHNSSEDGDSAAGSDKKDTSKQSDSGEKVSSDKLDDKKVREESEKTDDGVHSSESRSDKDSEQEGEGDAARGDDEPDEDQGKRPGKSNPKIERRFQHLTGERNAAIKRAEAAEQKLAEVLRQQEQAKVESEDPEYTIDDFRRVYNERGEVVDLTPDQAELAWRRWKDGYEQRQAERFVNEHHRLEQEKQEQQVTQQLMQRSVEAQEALEDLLESTPELDVNSPKFDQQLSDVVVPMIQDSIIIDPNTGAIVGHKIQPKLILQSIRQVMSTKRNLPLNGLNDNVDVSSGVRVNKGRSSDLLVNQANELFEELGIDKRF